MNPSEAQGLPVSQLSAVALARSPAQQAPIDAPTGVSPSLTPRDDPQSDQVLGYFMHLGRKQSLPYEVLEMVSTTLSRTNAS